MTERRYTRREAFLRLATRGIVIVVCSPFLLSLRAIGGDDLFDEVLPVASPIRLIDGGFYP